MENQPPEDVKPAEEQKTPKKIYLKNHLKKYSLKCSVPGCTTAVGSLFPDGAYISMHKYPHDKRLRWEWLRRVPPLRRGTPHICSMHFSARTRKPGQRTCISKRGLPDISLATVPPPPNLGHPLADHDYWDPFDPSYKPHEEHDYFANSPSIKTPKKPETPKKKITDYTLNRVLKPLGMSKEFVITEEEMAKNVEKTDNENALKKIVDECFDLPSNADENLGHVTESMGQEVLRPVKYIEIVMSQDSATKIYWTLRQNRPPFKILRTEFAIMEKYLVEIVEAMTNAEKLGLKRGSLPSRVKMLCAAICAQSSHGRAVLEKFTNLPSESVLKKWLNLCPFPRFGVNFSIVKMLRKVSEKMSPLNRYCAISYDKRRIRKKVDLDMNWDSMAGYVSLSDGKITNAQFVLVFMAHGLLENWRIPVAFYYSTALRGISRMIFEVIDMLESADFKVIATISTARPYNHTVVKDLIGQSCHFERNGRKVFCLFDPRHLVKITRDLFFGQGNWRVEFGPGVIADGNDVRTFFQVDNQEMTKRLAPKLSQALFQRSGEEAMEQSLQLFSNTVHSAMYARQAIGLDTNITDTADFILVIDELFDSLNATSMTAPEDKPCKSAIHHTSRHREFWTDATDWISKWRILFQATNRKQKKVFCQWFWITSLNSIMGLWDFLHPLGYQCLPTAWLNIKPLDAFFESVTTEKTIPLPLQFQKAFKAELLAIVVGLGGNRGLLDSDAILQLCLEEIDEAILEHESQPLIHVPNIPADFSGKMFRAIFDEIQKLTGKCGDCRNSMTSKITPVGLRQEIEVISSDFIETVKFCEEIYVNEGKLHAAPQPIRLLQEKMKAGADFRWFSCDTHKETFINGFTQFMAVILLRDSCLPP